ncbi:MAG TPA: TonB family protein [Candidatus Eremiobacteraceae bacterium]|nr:TonB family protein [Candidatus Eremiobacteraceae bacterium]
MSSAANTLPPLSTSGTPEQAAQPRPNPVPLEVAVAVSGAKPASDNGSRDLFSEDTTTVLVFKDGAVIRLVAPVSPGQLLFLTNKKTNHEVVCQVLRRRDVQQQSCYVELQFTEDRPNFWEVGFPADPDHAPKLNLPDHLHAQQTTTPESDSPLATHPPEDVDQLRKEVEALRAQLLVAQKNEAAQPAPKPAANPSPAAPRSPNPVPADAKPVAAEPHAIPSSAQPAPVNNPAPPPTSQEPAPALLMPDAKDKSPVPRPVVRMALPVRKPEPALDTKPATTPPAGDASGDDLLPKPELDFSQLPHQPPHGQAASAVPASTSKVRVVALVVVLLAALAGASWYGQWWRYLPLTQRAATSAPKTALKPKPAPPKPPAPASATHVVSASAAPTPAKLNAAKDAEPPRVKSEPAASTAPARTPVEQPSTPSRALDKNKSAARHNSTEDHAAPPTAEPTTSSDLVPTDAAVLPPKLLKPASPVYPPDAMRNYITGDVRAEVLIDASGHVADVKVLSGPQALRQAAVDALKQYQYSPATQAGKPAQSKATEVVKFWFNP